MLKKLVLATLLAATVTAPALAETRREREARHAREARQDDRDGDRSYDECRRDRKKAGNKGTIIGAAGAGGVSAVAGGNLGTSLLAAGVGAVAGNAIGKSGKKC